MSGICEARTDASNSRLRLITLTRRLAANRIPRAIETVSPAPSESSTRIGMIFAR
jgi:hypothetical protein